LTVIFIMKNSLKIILQFFTKNGKKKLLIKQFKKNFYTNSKLVKYKDILTQQSSNWTHLKMIHKWFEQNKSFIFLAGKNAKKQKKKKTTIQYNLLPLFNYKKNITSVRWLKKDINLSSHKVSKNIYNLIYDKFKINNKLNEWNSKYKLEHYDIVNKNKKFVYRKNYNKYKKKPV